MITETLLSLLSEHGIIGSFLAGFITGETVIVVLAFFAAKGLIPLWYVLVFCTLGMYLSDFIPFTIGKFKFWRNLFKGKSLTNAKKIEDKFLKYTRNNLFLTLFYTKFMYGASIPALIYLGYKKTSYSRFAFYNLLVELIFVPTVVAIGWYSGKGFTMIETIFKDIRIAISLLIFIIILVFLVKIWLNKLIKKQIQLK